MCFDALSLVSFPLKGSAVLDFSRPATAQRSTPPPDDSDELNPELLEFIEKLAKLETEPHPLPAQWSDVSGGEHLAPEGTVLSLWNLAHLDEDEDDEP